MAVHTFWAAAIFVTGWMFANPLDVTAQVAVTTYHNDNARTGQNLLEISLTPVNVNATAFGKLFSYAVDGYVYAQPLYVPSVQIPGQGVHNVVFVATEHDSVYAFDADGSTQEPLWDVSFIDAANGVTTVPAADVLTPDLVPEIGVTSTPVIDATAGTIYVIAKTKEIVQGSVHYRLRLHALDVATGVEKLGGPAVIADTIVAADGSYVYVLGPFVPGSGAGSLDGSTVHFNALRQLNRSGLLLVNGVVYSAWGSHGDNGPYHGWLLGHDAQSLGLVSTFNTTPNGGLGAIWMNGGGPAADANGNIYVSTGNGTFALTGARSPGYGDSVLKLSPNGQIVTDFFTPWNEATLAIQDADLGSGGVLLLPDQPSVHPHLMVAAGKEGKAYLIDRDDLGEFRRCGSTCDGVIQVLPAGTIGGGVFDTPAYFNGRVYYQGCCRSVLKAFALSNGLLSSAPVSQATPTFGYPAGTPSVSANGSTNGIVWTLQVDAYKTSGPAILHAFDALDLSNELYSSGQRSADRLDGAVKSTVPTIANGKVYVGTQTSLAVFGAASRLTSLSPNSATAGGAAFDLRVTGSSFPPDSVVYWNGAARITTFVSSTQLTAAIPASDIAAEGTALVTVRTPGGTFYTGLTFAMFRLACGVDQFFAEYFNNIGLSGTPTFTACEPSITYNWGASGPGSGIGIDNFSVRWTGSFNFAAGATAFTATADDGIRVWVDDDPIVDGWVDQSPTKFKATPTLTEGTHLVKVEYYEHGGGAVAQVSWTQACPAGQYTAEYYNNTTLSGNPTFTRCEASINYNWGASGPGNGIGVDNFSVRWRGTFNFTAGSTVFTATADDGIRVWLDATQIINAWLDQGATTYKSTVNLTQGPHQVTVEYYEHTGAAVAQASWQQSTNPVPTISSLAPSSASAAGPAFTLTVNGNNFVSSSIVQWNGAPRTTTFVDSTQLKAAIAATDITTAGTAAVTVVSPAPGGGTSTPLTFTISAPAGVLQFSSATYSVGESGGTATTTVTRTGGNSGAVGITFATSNGTATGGADYTAVT
jgi:PA14 domain-containing protein/Calx-beta domain-containing protein/IPT/TIG domain-containing protein